MASPRCLSVSLLRVVKDALSSFLASRGVARDELQSMLLEAAMASQPPPYVREIVQPIVASMRTGVAFDAIGVADISLCVSMAWDTFQAASTNLNAMCLQCLLYLVSSATLLPRMWNLNVPGWLGVIDSSHVLNNISAEIRRGRCPTLAVAVFTCAFPDLSVLGAHGLAGVVSTHSNIQNISRALTSQRRVLMSARDRQDEQGINNLESAMCALTMWQCAQVRSRESGCLNSLARLLKRTRNVDEAMCCMHSLTLCCKGSMSNATRVVSWGVVGMLSFFVDDVSTDAAMMHRAISTLLHALMDVDANLEAVVCNDIVQDDRLMGHLVEEFTKNCDLRALLLRVAHKGCIFLSQRMPTLTTRLLFNTNKSVAVDDLAIAMLRAHTAGFISQAISTPADIFAGWSCTRARDIAEEIIDDAIRDVTETETDFVNMLLECASRLCLHRPVACFRENQQRLARRAWCADEVRRLGGGTVTTSRDMCCPITLSEMIQPYTGKDGFNYERSAIVRHIKSHGSSPLTREKMSLADVRPNNGLQSIIDAHYETLVHVARSANGNECA